MDRKAIVVLNYGRWDSLRRGIHQYCMRLSRIYDVLYIHHPPERTDLEKADYLRPCPKLRRIDDSLYELEWPWWCSKIHRFHAVEDKLLRIRVLLIKSLLDKSRKKEIAFIYLTHPSMFDYLRCFPDQKKVYHIFDQYSYYGGKRDNEVFGREKVFLPKFDYVFCSSMKLTKEKKLINPKTYYLPNGVDYNLFSKATDKELPIPNDIQKIREPIIGYIGFISGKIDFDLVYFIAKSRPDWSLVFIGPKQLNQRDTKLFEDLSDLDNFHYLGYKPPGLLANYMKPFRIGIMPYRLTGHVPWGFPLKMYEYMAAGLPSVAAELDSIEEKDGIIYKGHDEKEWVESIELALKQSYDPLLISERQKIAAENTWDHRVNELLSIVEATNS
ncbi:glycosyltransferase [bacterium]|nr:glycosyltransferase [bacterium]